MTALGATDPTMAARAEALLHEHQGSVYRRANRLFTLLLIVQWLGAMVISLVLTPLTWVGATSKIHYHVWTAILLGGVIAALPIAMMFLRPASVATRHCVAAAQMAFSAVLIHLTGGRIETHFHVFGSLAFLALYRDWKVLLTASVTIAIDHWARGVYWPQSVFGSVIGGPWRWLEHAGWVLFIDLFLMPACIHSTREMRQLALDRARVEAGRDATELEVQQRTAELVEARRAAEEASNAKTMFLANMSHEIRTPMTAILGYADLLRDRTLAEHERQDYVRIIRCNGDHLLELINEILDLSKVEAGQLIVQRTPIHLDSVLAEVESMMRVRAADKGLEMTLRFEDDAPRQIDSDAFRLRQVLVNLIGNAVKFTDSGAIDVVVRRDGGEGRPAVAIDVRDSGVGMNEEQMQHLFRPFTQVDSSMSRRHGGTGLGLAISRRLVELLGGNIGVRSEPGRGSVFTVRLPADTSVHSEQLPGATARAKPQEHGAIRLQGRILLAEDGPDNRRLLTTFLERAGATVETAVNGALAVDRVHEAFAAGRPYDLILMDMQMPELDGYDATVRLRAMGITTPIVAITANAMDSDRQRCMRAGCNDYATKPIDRASLLAVCARWLSKGARLAA